MLALSFLTFCFEFICFMYIVGSIIQLRCCMYLLILVVHYCNFGDMGYPSVNKYCHLAEFSSVWSLCNLLLSLDDLMGCSLHVMSSFCKFCDFCET